MSTAPKKAPKQAPPAQLSTTTSNPIGINPPNSDNAQGFTSPPVGSPSGSAVGTSFVPAKSYTGELAGYYYNALNSMSSALSSEQQLKRNLPAVVLGEVVTSEVPQQATTLVRAVSYYTYRNRFPKPLANGADHDAGWGCMVRTGQMMLSEAVRRTLHCKLPPQNLNNKVSSNSSLPTSSNNLGASKRQQMTVAVGATEEIHTVSHLAGGGGSSSCVFPRPQPAPIRMVAPRIFGLEDSTADRVHAAASLFYDSPAAPFGIHNLTAAAAASAKLDVGQWFTPTALTRAVSYIMERGLIPNSTMAAAAPLPSSPQPPSTTTKPTATPSSSAPSSNSTSRPPSYSEHDHLVVGLLPQSPSFKPASRSGSDYEITTLSLGGGVSATSGASPCPKEVAADAAKHIMEVFEFVREHLVVVAPLDASVCVDDVLDALRGPPDEDIGDISDIEIHEDDFDEDDFELDGDTPPPTASQQRLMGVGGEEEGVKDIGTSVLLMVPVMAGAGGTLSDAYRSAVLQCLDLPSSLGVVGGKPNKSLYFVGRQEEAVMYLDPHTVQTAFVSPTTIGCRSGPKGIAPASLIDTSMVMCFYFDSEESFEEFQTQFEPIAKLTPFPLFSFISAEQKHAAEAATSRMFDDGNEEDDMSFGDEDDDYVDRKQPPPPQQQQKSPVVEEEDPFDLADKEEEDYRR